jgi:hypothetical protein
MDGVEIAEWGRGEHAGANHGGAGLKVHGVGARTPVALS